MQGGLAQTLGLVLTVNAARKGLPPSPWPTGSIWAFCKRVDFVGRTRPGFLGAKAVDTPDPDAFLRSLPNGAGARLRILPRNQKNISDRMSVAFAGGGPVFVAEVLSKTPEAWWGDWRVSHQGDPDNRIWSVTYRDIAGRMPKGAPAMIDAAAARAELQTAVGDALAFAVAQKIGFEQAFESSLALLGAADPLARFHYADMVPEGLIDLEHRQLLAAASAAWVFGGMGSWNDVGFEGDIQARYEALSDRLFGAILNALVAAADASL